MMRLLKIEWAKLAAYRPFWILLMFYLAAAPLLILFVHSIGINIFPSAAAEIYGFPNGWLVSAYMSSWFQILLGMIIVIFATNEFGAKTARQHIIDGVTRNEFFLGKVYMIAAISIFSTLYMSVIAIIASLIYTGGLSNIGDGIEYVPIFLFQTFGYLTIALLFSLLVRSSGYAILIFLCVIFAEWLFRQFVPNYIAGFSPIGMIARLTPIPFMQDFIDGISDSESIPYPLTIAERFTYGTAYIAGFLGLAYMNVQRKDF